MIKLPQKTSRSTLFFILVFLFITVVGCYVLSSKSHVAFAQLNGCAQINIGNPGSNVAIPAQCQTTSGTESDVVKKVIALALAHLKTGTYIMGTPPRNWAVSGSNPAHFDCSGFVGWAWYWGSDKKIVMLGQTNADWASNNPHYEKVVTSNASRLQPGDLIYINNGMAEAQPGHVGMYIGKDKCGANDCYIQYYSDGLPGNELSWSYATSHGWGKMMGFIRMKNV